MFLEFMDKLQHDLGGPLPAGQGCFKTHYGTCLARQAMKGLACYLTGAYNLSAGDQNFRQGACTGA